MSYEDAREPEPEGEPHGTCDWGYCDQPATRWRWSKEHGWLMVCDDCFDVVDEWL